MSNPNDSTDAVLQIAQRNQEKKEGLVEPQPIPYSSDLVYQLEAGDRNVCLPQIPANEAWFQEELQRQRENAKPWLSNHAPEISSVRETTYLQDFLWRVEQSLQPNTLPDALAGAGSWEQVTIPHYGGPIGKATAFYRTSFDSPPLPKGQRQWLRFEGVDYVAKVFLNGNFLGQHEGFFAPFEYDVTPYLNPDQDNTLLVQVENDAVIMGNTMWDSKEVGDKIYAATGPGWDDPYLGWHHCPPGMGIYQNVYLETRPTTFISDLFARPLPQESAIELWLELNAQQVWTEEASTIVSIFGKNFSETPLDKQTLSLTGKPGLGRSDYRIRLELPEFRTWSPEQPWLYQLQVQVGDDVQAIDFGMREFRMETDSEPKGRLFLNDQPIRLRGVNTMGHEQQCVMANDQKQLIDDLLIYKMAGLNYIRFTQRPVQREVYAACDALGLLGQADLPLFKNLRRPQFHEAVRQCCEMERFVRRHPSVIISSFINEPFPLVWHNALHRDLSKEELLDFFQAVELAIHQENPDRVIKPVDGDYDPPSPGLPDNHCYSLWYNGHGLPFGKLEAGYWQRIKPGWNYACGEYGGEGLDSVDLMRRRYPVEWLPQSQDEEKMWTPRQIRKAQTGDMYQVFFDRPESLADWVEASQDFQAWSVGAMTEALRRDPRMVSFALHLGIDAFPSGWMKTIVDCERRPKKAYFTVRNALAPVLPTLRAPRRHWYGGEEFQAEVWISNDHPETLSQLILATELEANGKIIASGKNELPEIPVCTSIGAATVQLDLPALETRAKALLRLQVLSADCQEKLGTSTFGFSIFPRTEAKLEIDKLETALHDLKDRPYFEWKANTLLASAQLFTSGALGELLDRVQNGATLVLYNLETGTYQLGPHQFEIKPIGMGQLTFASRATGHPMVEGFEANDFRLWFDESTGYASTFSDHIILGEGWNPVLMGGHGGFGEAWQPTPVVAEKPHGKGKLILCQLQLSGRLRHNPPAQLFAERLFA